ncbi:NAD(P)/FAD-dependent oxidoreductase [Mycobacterium sp. RTGN5]|uniref:flavin-containing monooxygenase n=1 Tax=Mycobacterium sp. RTGN5 TaxID=3016522 RepID=UPI0029C82F92|nr:NAD(P)/FAD-dependent oxidoreductase [Mycobacterium sp. RTGN5]
MTGLPFDPDALRARYAREREVRLRPDGVGQYVEVAGDFAGFAEDPWSGEPAAREPLTDEVDVAIIGAGFGGLLTGARLRELGVQRIRLIDKAADVGGTWYWNRYPGIACDVESYVYMPLLEETGYLPTEKYAKGPEIFAHCQRIAEHYDLYRDACLHTEVRQIRWDEHLSRWIVETDRGDAIRARFVSMANGYLQKPKLPGIPGITAFSGHTFHTSRWDYDYTGKDLELLADKRIGIIGTGATAVQCVPHLARAAGHLSVFQRTPSSVDVRNNQPTDPQWAADLTPGWQRRRIENFQQLTAGGEADEDLVADAWTSITKTLLVMRDGELADFAKMEEVRARVDAIVTDADTAEALKPWYGYFCKRPCFHDDYLATFNRPNVSLVDTYGHGVQCITERGVVVEGVEHDIDCLIFATGFEVGTEYARRTGFEIVGCDELTLTGKWRDGVRTLHGLLVAGFPNLFVESIAQSGFTVNFPYLLDVQASHVAWIIAEALARDVTRLEATTAAEDGWVDTVVGRSAGTADRARSCTPGYYNREGQANATTRQGSFFYGTPTEYADTLAAWRDDGTLDGLDITRGGR